MGERHRPSEASTGKLLAAFAAVYLIWGSTYLGIHYAIQTLPPFLMAGVRFLVAGAILYVWARLKGIARPTGAHWRSAAIIGACLLLGGNGLVVWAEQHVASGVAALLVATVSFWMVLLEWLRPGGTRPTPGMLGGVALGFGGLVLLVGPDGLRGEGIHLLGALALVLASFTWAVGSIYAKRAPLPRSPLMVNGIEMLAGGALLFATGLLRGETQSFDLAVVSPASLLALLYLITFGSLIGFSAYVYLLGATTPARASTYAYVNPVVAMLLGWAVAGEPLTPRMLLAMAIIIAAVVVITLGSGKGAREAVTLERRGRRRSAGVAGERAA
jgi:drug/metabolite transporter (DMT)-like permease